jgi:hypothetical protein
MTAPAPAPARVRAVAVRVRAAVAVPVGAADPADYQASMYGRRLGSVAADG